jgi:magnesium transporter
MKDSTILVESIKKLLRRGAAVHLLNMLVKIRPADLAEGFKSLDEEEKSSTFRLLAERANPQAAALLGLIHPAHRPDLLRGMSPEDLAPVLQRLPSDEVAEILSGVAGEDRERILSLMQKEASEEVQDLLEYEEDTAGRIMTTRFLALPESTSVQQAIAEVQKAQEAEMVFYLYVMDAQGGLKGVLSLRKLLSVPPATQLREIMSTELISAHPETDQEEVARIASQYDLLAVPIVDADNVLIGIVTIDDVVDVMREEATEDIYKFAGTSDEERLTKSTLKAARLRLPWLFAAFGGGVLGALVIKSYTPLPPLACFIPVVLGMGGNIGTQAATIMARGLSTGRISLRAGWGVVFKEIRIALLLGLVFGALLGMAAIALMRLGPVEGLAVGASLWMSMGLASVLGAILPVLLKTLHIDPAVATNPFVTTSVDLLGLLSFFVVAGPHLADR